MALDPRPVRLTTVATNPSGFDPEPLVVIAPATAGTAGLVTRQAAVANQPASTVATDFASQKVQLDATITKLNALLTALRAAGVIVP